MREFFIGQMDYIFFLCGLAFILLALSAHFIFRTKPTQGYWKWIALFGFMYGMSEWLEMLVLSLGSNAPFTIARLTLLTASFLCFVEVVRLDARKLRGKIFGPWIYVPLLAVTLVTGWILDGLTGIHILSRYIFGVLGGLLAARIIGRRSASEKANLEEDRTRSIFSWLLACYAATQLFSSKGTSLPASLITQEAFLSFLGFPVQLLCMLLAIAMAGMVWKEYAWEILRKYPEKLAEFRHKRNLWFPVGLIAILLASWIFTGVFSRNTDKEERADRLNHVKIASTMIDTYWIKNLSGTPADLESAPYKHIQRQFLEILKDMPEVFYIYIFGQKDGKHIFLSDSTWPGRAPLGEPLASPGEVYEEDTELLGRMFSSGGAFTVGPETDKWGTFVSGYVAIRDPASDKVIAVLGFDFDAVAWKRMMDNHRLAPILSALLFSVIWIVFFVILRREQEVRLDAEARESKFRKSEESLKESEKRFLDVFYSAKDATLLISENIFVDANEATARMLGYAARKDFLEMHPSKLSPPTQPDGKSSFEKAEEMMRLAREKGFHQFEWMHRKASGMDFPVQVSLTPITLHGKTIIHCTWVDLTQKNKDQRLLLEFQERLKKQAGELSEALGDSEKSREIMASMLEDNNETRNDLEKSLQQLRSAHLQLVHAEKMEAIGRMASGVAHEVKNPLGILLQGINYFEESLPPGDKDQREALQMMKESVRRADKIVRGLLDFARVQEPDMALQDINAILESSLDMVRHRQKLNPVEFVCELGKNLPQMHLDRSKMEQVFVNLFNNAVDAMPSGGKLFVRSYLPELKEKGILVEVEDTGEGIAEDVMNKVFDPFFTTKKQADGTGLGLSIAKSIIEMHECSINVESKKGQGTKFTITFKTPGG